MAAFHESFLLPIRYHNRTIMRRYGILCSKMPERKLLDQVSDVARLRHLRLETEET
jgi:hypothetical protein